MAEPWPTLLALAATCQAVNLAGRLIVARLVGAKVEQADLFYGPHVIRYETQGGTVYRLGLIPLGNSVRFAAEPGIDGSFNELHPLRRVALVASGSASLVLLALVLLGPARGLRSLAQGIPQVLAGAWAPGTMAQDLLSGLFAVLRRHSWTTGLGVVAAKFTAMNLLPFPNLDGGQILLRLLAWRRPEPARWLLPFHVLGIVIAAAILVGWIAAFGLAWLRS
jgi:membrane-associated protease RseP (regulator of RpoE activity)